MFSSKTWNYTVDNPIITLKIYYDFIENNSYYTEAHTFNSNDLIVDGDKPSILQIQAIIANQKCNAMKIEISSNISTSNNIYGIRLINLGAEVGVKKGFSKKSKAYII